MSNRALAVAATLQAEMPELTFRLAQATDAPETIDVTGGPVITIRDGLASGFDIAFYADEEFDHGALAAELYRAATKRSFALGESELTLMSGGMKPVLNAQDIQVGERLIFTTLHHSGGASA